jgi:putative ABC transport system substrate-binding protein
MTAPGAFLVATAIGLALAPFATCAQQAAHRVAFIAMVSPLSELSGPEPINPGAHGFVRGLREHGFVEGRNLVLDWRSLEGRSERFEEVAADVARAKPDVAALASFTLVPRFRKVNTTIPIVTIFAGDHQMVGTEFVQSLARPGGSVTGVSATADPRVEEKRFALLLEAVPKAARISFLGTQTTWEGRIGGKSALLPVAQRFGVSVSPALISSAGIAEAFAFIERERPDAVFVSLGPVTYGNRAQIGRFALVGRVPTSCFASEFVEHGCLMSYGAPTAEFMRRLGEYVAKILKGAKPGDLPIEQPSTMELAINLKTAKALGLMIPQSLLIRADRVIE